MESETTAVQTESFEAQVGRLREHPAYTDRGHYQHKEIVQQVENLYKQKHGDTKQQQDTHGQDFQPEPIKRFDGGDDLSARFETARAEGEKMGFDFSGEDFDGTVEQVEKLEHYNLLGQGQFDELAAKVGLVAHKAGVPFETVKGIREFFTTKAQPNDELSERLSDVIIEYIYQKRKRRS